VETGIVQRSPELGQLFSLIDYGAKWISRSAFGAAEHVFDAGQTFIVSALSP